jgi:homogentisate 1,2-dioxygenase
MHYYSLGSIPHKRHTQFRKADGSLYSEQLFSTEGFNSLYSIIYHCHPPTQIVQVGNPVNMAPKLVHDKQLKHRSLKGFSIAPEADYLQSRKAVLVNDDCQLILLHHSRV